MEHLSGLLTIAVVSLLAAISPGPDFFIVLRNSMVYSRRCGLMTALGVSAALIVHLSYTLVGIGLLIAESPFLYTLLKYVGVLYLFYLGTRGLLSSFKMGSASQEAYTKSATELSSRSAFMQGVLTNVLNPKCALFFISLFSQFIDPSTPLLVRVEYAIVNWSISLGWFVFLVLLVTGKMIHGKLHAFRVYIDRVMGSALIFLGFKLLLV